uniref:mechanosensitive ion channel family protein n=1 Tax=Ndongobacter massiliensis TaxID=1871025 RepID=UPI00093109D9|nr:mechanosensitive ion channel family protein [Ndongobacter massiliensis]
MYTFGQVIGELQQNTPWLYQLLVTIFIIGLFLVALFVVRRFLEHIGNVRLSSVSPRKKKTVLGALYRVTRVILLILALSFILETWGVRTGSFLATAGIGGIALAFGAQSIVADVITGSFILLEDQFDVGDYVKIGDIEGNVETIGLRRTTVRAYSGALHSIPNSKIQIVSNFQRRANRADASIEVPNTFPLAKLLPLIEKCSAACRETGLFTMPPYFIGVEAVNRFSYRVLIGAESKPDDRWAGARHIRQDLLQRLRDAGAYDEGSAPDKDAVLFEAAQQGN